MSAKFFAILTHQGAARLANAAALGTTLNLTQMAVGDANGTLPVPDPAQTKLLNQKRIAPLNLLSIDPNNASQIIAEQIIPENEGGFWIREIGLYDDAGVLIAVANCPETYKPQLQEGSGRTQTIRMVLIVSSTESVTLKIDPSVVLATRKYADDLLVKHVAETDPHSQYAPKKSPTFTGKPTAPTAAQSENSTQLATTAFVKTALEKKQPLDDTLTALAGKDVAELIDYLGIPGLLPEEAPFPDVWIPFNDGLQMLAGNGPYDRINIGADYVELTSRSVQFMRASTATYIDKSGVLQTAEINEPRFEKRGLLLEKPSTNLVINSKDMVSGTNTGIMGTGVAPVKTGGFMGPDGSNNAMRVQLSRQYATTSNRSMITIPPVQFMPVTPVPTATYLMLSVWLKSNTAESYEIDLRISRHVKTVTVQPYWQRFEVGGDIPVGETDSACYVAALYGGGSVSADILTFGVQIENQPLATSYIPTAGSAATRAMDYCAFKESGNIAPATECTISVEIGDFKAPGQGELYARIFEGFSIGFLYHNPTLGSGKTFFANAYKTPQMEFPFQATESKENTRIAYRVRPDRADVMLGNVVVNRAYTPPNPAIAPGTIALGNNPAQSGGQYSPMRMHIRNFRIWHRALTDAQLKSLR